MNDLRIGRDPTIDKDLTWKNVWMTGRTEDDVPAIAQAEIDRINMARKEQGLRALRKDAVSVIQIVEKPPLAYMENLAYADKVRFLSDSHKVMSDIIRQWNPQWKCIAAVQHHDEFGGLSAHTHSMWLITSTDKNGIPCMNAKAEVGLKFFSHINKTYAAGMRALGYSDVEDPLTYDSLSEEEKIKRSLEPKQTGIDGYLYKKQMQQQQEKKLAEVAADISQTEETLKNKAEDLRLTERMLSETQTALTQKQSEINALKTYEDKIKVIVQKAVDVKNEADAREKLYNEKIDELNRITGSDPASYVKLLEENRKQAETIARQETTISRLTEEIRSLKMKVLEWQSRFETITRLAGRKLMQLFGLKTMPSDIPDLPTPEIASGIRNMIHSSEIRHPENYRVLPDPDAEGKYRIALRDNNTYKTIRSGFDTREAAEAWRRAYTSSALSLSEPDIKNGFKKG